MQKEIRHLPTSQNFGESINDSSSSVSSSDAKSIGMEVTKTTRDEITCTTELFFNETLSSK